MYKQYKQSFKFCRENKFLEKKKLLIFQVKLKKNVRPLNLEIEMAKWLEIFNYMKLSVCVYVDGQESSLDQKY